jgi:hypothetical protein
MQNEIKLVEIKRKLIEEFYGTETKTTMQSNNFIGLHSDRGTGKTTALLQFAAALTLLEGLTKNDCPDSLYAFYCPTESLRRRYKEVYTNSFPGFVQPDFRHFDSLSCGPRQSSRVAVAFVDEVFQLKPEQLEALKHNVSKIIGVGTQYDANIRIVRL